MYLDTLVRGLELTVEMAWDTWWALVLGLTISGAVEVFVGEERMRGLLGGDGWEEVGLGAALGVASSSCSYSAVGTTKTLFKKGASAPAALGAFMFASTDLVVELGLAMWVLLGWQFVVGEYLGGVVAVVVLAVVFKHLVPGEWVEAAREHVRDRDGLACATCDAAVDPEDPDAETVRAAATDRGDPRYFCCSGCRTVHEATGDGERSALRSAAGWHSAASATMKDWEMIGRDLAVGFVIAGFVGAAVPQSWWTALFGTQGTFSGVLLNTVIAVLIGILTFMCSVGNVPFALVLWRNGLPFGSVLSFIYADLLIPPLVSLYRRYYGTRMAAVLFAALFLAAVVAGVVVHYVLGGLGLIPTQGAVGGTVPDEYTTVLNVLFTPVFAGQVLGTYGRDGVRRRAEAGVRRAGSLAASAWTWLSLTFLALVGALMLLRESLQRAASRVGPLAAALRSEVRRRYAAGGLAALVPVRIDLFGRSLSTLAGAGARGAVDALRALARWIGTAAAVGWALARAAGGALARRYRALRGGD